MKLLLDTNAFLWFVSAPSRLGRKARAAIENAENGLFWSAASEWELAIKVSLGRIELAEGWQRAFAEERASNRIADLPVSVAHCLPTATLPWHHRDPFDRLLVSQAIAEGLTLITKDESIRRYDVETLW